MQSLPKANKNTIIYTADFASLFTNLPHVVIQAYMTKLLKICFDNAGKRYVKVGFNKCYYTDEYKNGNVNNLDKEDIMYLIDTVLQNSYAKYGNFLFKQINGIPQGNNSSPLLADLTLTMMEFEFCNKKENKIKLKGLNNAYRYADDIDVLSSKTFDFEKIAQEIYHKSLTLEKTNKLNTKTQFLDIEMEIQNNKFNTKLYNKTNDYHFEVIRYSNYNSNTPQIFKNNIIAGEVLRIARLSSNEKNFNEGYQNIKCHFIKNNYPTSLIKKTTEKVLKKHNFLSFITPK